LDTVSGLQIIGFYIFFHEPMLIFVGSNSLPCGESGVGRDHTHDLILAGMNFGDYRVFDEQADLAG
jgi:hypothetical protein